MNTLENVSFIEKEWENLSDYFEYKKINDKRFG